MQEQSSSEWGLEKISPLIPPFVISLQDTGQRSAASNVFDYRCLSDCRSRGHEFDPGLSLTFVDIDHEIISTAILLPSADSRRDVVSYKGKYVQEVLVNRLVKPVQEKKCGQVT